MPSTSASQDAAQKAKKASSTDQAKTEILLSLWNAGILENVPLPKGKLPETARKPQYRSTFQQLLDEDGAIATTPGKTKRSPLFFLTEKGIGQLGDLLKTVTFEFPGTSTGAWMAIALLKWIQQMDRVEAVAVTNGKSPVNEGAIA